MRKARLPCLTAAALFIAGCAADVGNLAQTSATPPAASRPLLPPPPPPVLPDKPRTLAEPECKALLNQMQSCARRIKDDAKKAAYQRRTVEVAETLGSMEPGQRKASCKADLPAWRKDCGGP